MRPFQRYSPCPVSNSMVLCLCESGRTCSISGLAEKRALSTPPYKLEQHHMVISMVLTDFD